MTPPKKRGRPKGSRNKTKADADVEIQVTGDYKARLRAGVQFIFESMDSALDWGLGVDGDIWKLSDDESEAIVRFLLHRAKKGDKWAKKVAASIENYLDTAEVALIIGARAITTIKAVVANGRPKPRVGKVPSVRQSSVAGVGGTEAREASVEQRSDTPADAPPPWGR